MGQAHEVVGALAQGGEGAFGQDAGPVEVDDGVAAQRVVGRRADQEDVGEVEVAVEKAALLELAYEVAERCRLMIVEGGAAKSRERPKLSGR